MRAIGSSIADSSTNQLQQCCRAPAIDRPPSRMPVTHAVRHPRAPTSHSGRYGLGGTARQHPAGPARCSHARRRSVRRWRSERGPDPSGRAVTRHHRFARHRPGSCREASATTWSRASAGMGSGSRGRSRSQPHPARERTRSWARTAGVASSRGRVVTPTCDGDRPARALAARLRRITMSSS